MPTFRPLESITLCAPCLNSLALLSVGAPLIITIVAEPSPSALSLLTSERAWSWPTFWLSKEM